MAPNRPYTTAFPRLGADHVQHRKRADEHPLPPEPAPAKAGVLPLTRAEVSSEHTTGLAITAAWIAAAAATSGARARQHVADRALADRKAEDLVHQRGQPLHAVRVQRPPDAGAARARRPGAGGALRLLLLRRRQRGIVQRLGRLLVFG